MAGSLLAACRAMMAIALFATALVSATDAIAQASPARTIRFLIPTSPGSSADGQARVVAESFQALTGHVVVPENRLGAGGSVAAVALVNARPDGLTVGFQGKSFLLFGVEFPSQNFNPMRDVSPVAFISRGPFVMVVSASSSFGSLQSLIDYARANPGNVNYASAGQGSTSYLSSERVRAAAKVNFVHIPFKGSPEALRDVMGGTSQFTYIPASMAKPLIEAGRIRPLAVNSSKRSVLLPDVPTTIEAGIQNSNYESWLVALVPAGTPEAIQEQLNQQFNAAIKSQATADRFAKLGTEAEPMSLAALRSYVKKEYAEALEFDKQIRANAQ